MAAAFVKLDNYHLILTHAHSTAFLVVITQHTLGMVTSHYITSLANTPALTSPQTLYTYLHR